MSIIIKDITLNPANVDTELPVNCTEVQFDNVEFALPSGISMKNFTRAEIKDNCTYDASFSFKISNFTDAILPVTVEVMDKGSETVKDTHTGSLTPSGIADLFNHDTEQIRITADGYDFEMCNLTRTTLADATVEYNQL
jgi:hypothetical protein